MKITDAFVGEHGVLYPQLDRIERVAPSLATAAEARAIAGLLASALAGHAHLEEELLFVELDPFIGAEGGGPLAVMRAEHEDIEGSLGRASVTEDLSEATDLLLHVVDVARPHFAKEEDVLFPMAEQILPGDTLSAAGDRWAQRRLGEAARSGSAFA